MVKRARVAFVGAGNLAWHLAPALHAGAVEVAGVWGRRATDHEWPFPYATDLQGLPDDLTAVFISVPDHSIGEVAALLTEQLPAEVHFIHCSGSTSVDALSLDSRGSGAFWPIRSLTLGLPPVDFGQTTIGYYSANEQLQKLLAAWAQTLTSQAYCLDDEQRAKLHLASVIGQNFTNYFHHLAYRISTETGVPFSALHDLLKTLPLDNKDPISRQTGPAARGDEKTIQAHLHLLQGEKNLRDIYLKISALISDRTSKH